MVEAGANEIAEDTLLEALELAHARDQEALRGPGGAPRAAPASRSGSIPSSRTSSRPPTASDLRRASTPTGSARPRPRSTRSSSSSARRSRSTRPRTTSSARRRSAPASMPSSSAGGSRPSSAPVRAQFESELRALTDARAGLEGAPVGQARPALRADPRDGRACRSRSAPGHRRRRRAVRQGRLTRLLRQEGRRGDLQGAGPAQDRRREAPPGRPGHRRDPPDRLRGRRLRRGRTARRSSPADRRRS